MHKITKMIQDEAVEAVETEKRHIECEHAPPGAVYPGECSVHIDWVTAHHEEFTACVGDNVVNPDV